MDLPTQLQHAAGVEWSELLHTLPLGADAVEVLDTDLVHNHVRAEAGKARQVLLQAVVGDHHVRAGLRVILQKL